MTSFRMTERTARKRYTCCFCERTIELGARHIDGFALFNGEPSPWRAHLACQELARAFPYADEGVPAFKDWDLEDVAELSPDQYAVFKALRRSDPGRP